MKISKELLSEVLGYEALPTQVSTKNLQYIDKRRKHGAFHPCCINIYELSHRCKEWALTQGYYLASFKNLKEGICTITKRDWVEDFRANSEQQAVFDACEQILKWSKNNK